MPVADIGGGASSRNAGDGAAFLIAAGIVYEIIAAACSSPQTTEINADTRAKTLMKWVHIGLLQSAGFIAAAAIIEPGRARPIIAGGSIAAVVMYASYAHAKHAGKQSNEPGTEGQPSLVSLGRPGFQV